MDVCRTCLTVEVSKNLSDLPQGLQEETITYTEIMQLSLNIQILPDQKISTMLCDNCYIKIMDIYKFKIQALKSEEYLMEQSKTNDSKNILLNVEDSYEFCSKDFNHNSEETMNVEIKNEVHIKEESECAGYDSDDMLLSDIKQEYVTEEVKENLPVKKKRGRKKGSCAKKSDTRQICVVCGKTVKNMTVHMISHQPKSTEKKFECQYCKQEFKSYGARYKHIKIKHHGIKNHCYLCNKDVVNLKSHTLTMHESNQLPFSCNVCSRRFISPSRLKEHLLFHTKEKPFVCDVCDKKFVNKPQMLLHKRRVHDKEKQNLCQFCSKSFFKKYALQVHLRSHSKEKPYECKTCGKWFSSCTVLKTHKMLHTNEKTFACKFCDMTFANPRYLSKHMVVHTKEKNYPCKYCGVRFGRSDHRLRHQKTAHEKYFVASE